jgi:hypothetical protein
MAPSRLSLIVSYPGPTWVPSMPCRDRRESTALLGLGIALRADAEVRRAGRQPVDHRGGGLVLADLLERLLAPRRRSPSVPAVRGARRQPRGVLPDGT